MVMKFQRYVAMLFGLMISRGRKTAVTRYPPVCGRVATGTRDSGSASGEGSLCFTGPLRSPTNYVGARRDSLTGEYMNNLS